MTACRVGSRQAPAPRYTVMRYTVMRYTVMRYTVMRYTVMRYTVTGLPFSGTTTLVGCPFISATNLSASGSIIGNEP
jgi:hypothetical protein